VAFVDSLKEEFYSFGNYDDQYMRWTSLCQKRDQIVSEYTNIFHTLRSKLGIKDYERNLVLKYHNGIHKHIQTEMDFLDISSLGVSYRYAIKIEQKFKQQSKWEKHGKGNSNSHNEGWSKEDIRKWCEFHNIPWNNIDGCRSIHSLVVELIEKELNPDLDPDSENNKRIQIIDAETIVIVATAKI
jgi:hypothetical protein